MTNAAGNNNEIKVFVVVKPIPLFWVKVCSGEMKEVFLLIESPD